MAGKGEGKNGGKIWQEKTGGNKFGRRKGREEILREKWAGNGLVERKMGDMSSL